MHPVFYYIIFFLFVGAIGFILANRRASLVEKRKRWLKYFTYIPITGIVVASMFLHFFTGVAIVLVIAGLLELIKVNPDRPTAQRVILSLVIYLLIATGFVLFSITFHKNFLLYLYIQVLVFDGFSQIAGQIAGKHPLVPGISPTKTWEGLIGGAVFCLATAISAAGWVPVSFLVSILFGMMTVIFCFTGDILASWYKRKTGVKDYSNWLPGHGGFLDRFDSFLVCGATYYLLYLFIFRYYSELADKL